jgi:hypothetical protein
MKAYPAILLAATLCAGGCQSASTSAMPAALGNVTVNFHEPDKFTDVRDSNGGGTSEYYLEILSKKLKETAAPLLAEGQTLSVTFNDIDLAGDIPPGRIDDVRIIKEIYIPRMALTFQLKDANGKVISEGERKLSDMGFQMRLSPAIDRNEPLYYDQQMLSDWVRKEFKKAG